MGYINKELFTRQMTRNEFLQLAEVVVLSDIVVNNFISTFKSHMGYIAHNSKNAKEQSGHKLRPRKYGK